MIYKDLSNREYHSRPEISSTAVKTVAKQSVAHWVGAERKETPAMQMGSAVHGLCLEPHLNEVVRGPETRRGNAWKDAVAKATLANQDAIVLTEADYDKADAIATSARNHPVMEEYLNDAHTQIETSVILDDPDVGVPIRVRPDIYNSRTGILIDLKTTLDASPRGFQRQAYKLGYHIQAFMYMRALELEGLSPQAFAFLAVENAAPYATCIHWVSDDLLKLGALDYERAMEQIKIYQDTGIASTGWPDEVTMHAPAWAMQED
jgi:hypothetical protein